MSKNKIFLQLIFCLCSIVTLYGSELEQRKDSIKELLMVTSETNKRLELLEKMSYLSMDD